MTSEWVLERIRRRKGPLGFGRGGDSQINVSTHVATATDGGVTVRTEAGNVQITSTAMIFNVDGEVVIVSGGNPYSLNAKDLKKLLDPDESKELEKALARARASKKEKIKLK